MCRCTWWVFLCVGGKSFDISSGILKITVFIFLISIYCDTAIFTMNYYLYIFTENQLFCYLFLK